MAIRLARISIDVMYDEADYPGGLMGVPISGVISDMDDGPLLGRAKVVADAELKPKDVPAYEQMLGSDGSFFNQER